MTSKPKITDCSKNDEIVHKLIHNSVEMFNLHKYIGKLLKERNLKRTVVVTIDLKEEDEENYSTSEGSDESDE